ncbi:UNVERIFIED_CONTAM: hypothetical protein GTU68_067017, partial [Idotea baltica]|nr:hypothetical protein [Idotea baltica]
LAGNDIATLPDFPAEIRAPAGTVAGVSGFQIHFGSTDIHTPGDQADVLVAMNPAALKADLAKLRSGGTLIVNEDAFTKKNLSRVGYEVNPCEDGSLEADYRVYSVPVTHLTKAALEESGLTAREVERCKNFFTLGLMLWMYGRSITSTEKWLRAKFAKRPEIAEANCTVLKAGEVYGEATESFAQTLVAKADLAPGTYRNINGTQAMALGFVSAAQKSSLSFDFCAYPITPASDLLHNLAPYQSHGVTTYQSEDEIAAICHALGSSYAGNLGITSSSGPGIALKTEALGLAVMTELPLVVVNVQRAGPSTGMPTRTEQADLNQALFGRPGEAPLCVIAVSTPESAFKCAYEACRIAVKYMTPVMLMSDAYIANCSQPWCIPDTSELQEFESDRLDSPREESEEFHPYKRDEESLSRPWAIPGTAGYTHRIGGLEKQHQTGNVNYDPENHELMTNLRAEKVERIAAEIPALELFGESTGDVLVLGWGGTEGSIRKAVELAQEQGKRVSQLHLHFLNPLASDLGEVLGRFKHVLIPEINSGQLLRVIRSRYLVDAKGLNIVRGRPLRVQDIRMAINSLLEN